MASFSDRRITLDGRQCWRYQPLLIVSSQNTAKPEKGWTDTLSLVHELFIER